LAAQMESSLPLLTSLIKLTSSPFSELIPLTLDFLVQVEELGNTRPSKLCDSLAPIATHLALHHAELKEAALTPTLATVILDGMGPPAIPKPLPLALLVGVVESALPTMFALVIKDFQALIAAHLFALMERSQTVFAHATQDSLESLVARAFAGLLYSMDFFFH